MNALCISNTGKEDYLTVGKVYEVLSRSRMYGGTAYEVLRDRSLRSTRYFPRSLFKLTEESVSPRFPFRVKCKFDFTWVFPPGGGHRQRSLSEYITPGNVYEVTEMRLEGYYIMLPDHGGRTEELPEENFEPTDEPVTPNPDRETEQKRREAAWAAEQKEQEQTAQGNALRDSLDQYYNPEAYYARQANIQARVRILQKIFVCGLPYN